MRDAACSSLVIQCLCVCQKAKFVSSGKNALQDGMLQLNMCTPATLQRSCALRPHATVFLQFAYIYTYIHAYKREREKFKRKERKKRTRKEKHP